MAGDATRNKKDMVQAGTPTRVLDRSQMAVMYGVEGASKYAHHFLQEILGPHVTVAQNDKLLRREPFQADRSPDMKLVGADSNLSSQSVLKTVGKSG